MQLQIVRRIFSATWFSVVSRSFSTGTNLFVIFYISKFLDGKSLGIYGIAFFFFQLFAVVSYMGLEVFLGKEVAHRRENPKDLSSLLNELLVSSLYGAGLTVCLMVLFSLFYHQISFNLLVLSLIVGILYGMERNLSGIFLGLERVSVDAFYMFLSFCLTIACLLIFKEGMTLERIFLIRIGAFVIGNLGRFRSIFQGLSLPGLSWRMLYFKETMFFWFQNICVFAEWHIDLFILSFVIDQTLLGGYFLALRIYWTINLLLEVLSRALSPFISRVFLGKEKVDFQKFLNYLFFFSLVLGVILGAFLFFSRDLIISIFNKNLVSSCSPFLMWLSFVVPFKVSVYILGSVMSSSRFQKERFYISLVISLGFFVLLPVLINSYSALGAIYARVIFDVCVFVAYFYFVYIKMGREVDNSPLVKVGG
jgi:O-antigen/teichoic acid export membrane protein